MPGKSKKPVEAETYKDKVRQIPKNPRIRLDLEFEEIGLRYLWGRLGIGNTKIECRFKTTLAVYERLLSVKNNRRTVAGRTRQKLSRVPVKQAIEDWVTASSTAGSFELFKSYELQQYSAEQIVVDLRKEFEPHFVAAALDRLLAE